MKKQIEILLSQIAEIVQQDNAQKERTGENFNMFDILNIQANEMKHSAFIAELLNPKGRHGFGDVFLREFIKQIYYIQDFDTKLANVQIECPIIYGEQSGRIDILITSKNKAIIIENKIYAYDQPEQLLKYQKYIQSKSYEPCVIYLTHDGHEASERSTRRKINYIAITYRDNILPWLEICAKKASSKHAVHDQITQYMNIVKKITNINMSTTNSKKALSVLTAKENIDATMAILNMREDLRQRIFQKYLIKPLENFAYNNGLLLDCTHLFESRNYHRIFLYKNNWKRSAICIGSNRPSCWSDFLIGITARDYNNRRLWIAPNKLFEEDPDKYWPFGYEYLDKKYQNWDDNILPAMVKSEVIKHLKKKIKETLIKIDDLNLKRMP